MTQDEKEILDLIERETTAFLCRDYQGWADCWLQNDDVRRLGALMGGIMDYQEGWEAGAELIKRIMEKYPTPNPTAAQSTRRNNMSIRRSGDMAWASFDQYCERSDDPMVTVGHGHELRVFERHDGKWKISMICHGNSGLEYYDFPTIRVDAAGRIQWMNEQGRNELPDHPALMKSGAYLRGRYREDQSRLRSALEEASDLTPLDRRPSITKPRGRYADPVVLTGPSPDGQHIVWVSTQDNMLLVSFRDRTNEQARLEQAARLFELSPAQMRVSELILEGLDLPQVADRLDISPSTAKTHLSRIFDKTGARSQPALVARLLGVSPPK